MSSRNQLTRAHIKKIEEKLAAEKSKVKFLIADMGRMRPQTAHLRHHLHMERRTRKHLAQEVLAEEQGFHRELRFERKQRKELKIWLERIKKMMSNELKAKSGYMKELGRLLTETRQVKLLTHTKKHYVSRRRHWRLELSHLQAAAAHDTETLGSLKKQEQRERSLYKHFLFKKQDLVLRLKHSRHEHRRLGGRLSWELGHIKHTRFHRKELLARLETLKAREARRLHQYHGQNIALQNKYSSVLMKLVQNRKAYHATQEEMKRSRMGRHEKEQAIRIVVKHILRLEAELMKAEVSALESKERRLNSQKRSLTLKMNTNEASTLLRRLKKVQKKKYAVRALEHRLEKMLAKARGRHHHGHSLSRHTSFHVASFLTAPPRINSRAKFLRGHVLPPETSFHASFLTPPSSLLPPPSSFR